MRPASTPKPIGEAIDEVIRALHLGPRLKQFELLDRWPEIVGERVAKVTVADRFVDGKLFVRVAHAPWRNELLFLKREIIARINEAMHEEMVKDIVFR